MLFEKMPTGEKQKVTFGVDKETDFHEGPVAAQALGLFVADGCSDHETVMAPARLGVVISKLKLKDTRDGETVTVPAEMEMDQQQAAVLDTALTKFIGDTATAVTATLNASNPVGCASRVVEAGLAQNMQAELREAFELPDDSLTAPIPFGFA